VEAMRVEVTRVESMRPWRVNGLVAKLLFQSSTAFQFQQAKQFPYVICILIEVGTNLLSLPDNHSARPIVATTTLAT